MYVWETDNEENSLKHTSELESLLIKGATLSSVWHTQGDTPTPQGKYALHEMQSRQGGAQMKVIFNQEQWLEWNRRNVVLQWMVEALGATGGKDNAVCSDSATVMWEGRVMDKPCTCIVHLRGRKTERASVGTDWPISGRRQSLVLRWSGRGA